MSSNAQSMHCHLPWFKNLEHDRVRLQCEFMKFTNPVNANELRFHVSKTVNNDKAGPLAGYAAEAGFFSDKAYPFTRRTL